MLEVITCSDILSWYCYQFLKLVNFFLFHVRLIKDCLNLPASTLNPDPELSSNGIVALKICFLWLNEFFIESFKLTTSDFIDWLKVNKNWPLEQKNTLLNNCKKNLNDISESEMHLNIVWRDVSIWKTHSIYSCL